MTSMDGMGSSMPTSEIIVRINELKVADLKEALAKCGCLKTGVKAVLVERCISVVMDPTFGSEMASTLGAIIRNRGNSQSARTTNSKKSKPLKGILKTVRPTLSFVESPFMANTQSLGPPLRLSSGKMRSGYNMEPSLLFTVAVPQEISRLVCDPKQNSSNPTMRLYLRCGEKQQGLTLTDKYPRMTRWYLNSKYLKEATHTRYCAIDITDNVKSFCGVKFIQIELIRVKSMQPGPDYNQFAFQLLVASQVSAGTLLPQITGTSPTFEECREKAVRKLREDANDDDISCGPTTMSIHCPLSQMRMMYPARGEACSHLQCFDAHFYLMFNARKGAWTCPICNKPTHLKNVEIDNWMKKIINDCPPETLEVELESDGSFKPKAVEVQKEEPRKRARIQPPAYTSSSTVGGSGNVRPGGPRSSSAMSSAQFGQNSSNGLLSDEILLDLLDSEPRQLGRDSNRDSDMEGLLRSLTGDLGRYGSAPTTALDPRGNLHPQFDANRSRIQNEFNDLLMDLTGSNIPYNSPRSPSFSQGPESTSTSHQLHQHQPQPVYANSYTAGRSNPNQYPNGPTSVSNQFSMDGSMGLPSPIFQGSGNANEPICLLDSDDE